MTEHHIYVDTNFGFFFGSIENNQPHKHYAIQIGIALNQPITVTNAAQEISTYNSCIIRGNAAHKMQSSEMHLSILVNPISPLGHYLKDYMYDDISAFNHPLAVTLRTYCKTFLSGDITFKLLVHQIKTAIESLTCSESDENHFNDERIQNAIYYLEENFERVVPVDEIASYCYLSPSRFLHLFKEKTGITYRRAQLWNKISKSFAVIRTQSITATAHQFGFTDSAHYSKIFKQNFGFSPKIFLKK